MLTDHMKHAADVYKAHGWTAVLDHLDESDLEALSDDEYAAIQNAGALTEKDIAGREEGRAVAYRFLCLASPHPEILISHRHTADVCAVQAGNFHACWRNTVARARVALWVYAGGTITRCKPGPTWNTYGEDVAL